MILVLIGQIASGKTETARRVVEQTGAQLVTIDGLRSRGCDTSAAAIAQILVETPSKVRLIFECSGSALDFEELLAILDRAERMTTVVLLDCSIETAMRRIHDRPTWSGPRSGGSWAAQLRWVETCLRFVPADATISTDSASPEEVADVVLAAWHSAETKAKRIVQMPPSGTFSFSQLTTFEFCPLAYRYKYVDHKSEQIESRELFLGKRLHESLSYLYRAEARSETTEGELEAYLQARIKATLPTDIPQAKASDILDRGIRVLRFHYAAVYKHDKMKTLAMEKRFVLELSTELSFIGKIDRLAISLSGTYEVIDYKNSIRGSASGPRIPDLLQLAAYGVATMLEYGIPMVLLHRLFLPTGTDEKIVLRREDMPRIRLALRRWITHLCRTWQLTAQAGPHCGTCQFNPICPEAMVLPRQGALRWEREAFG